MDSAIGKGGIPGAFQQKGVMQVRMCIMIKHSFGEYVGEERTLIFIHIPKAAGTTLHRIIERQYPRNTIYTINGANVQKSIQEFKNLSEIERQKIRCLKGHMPFGLHKYLPRPAAYITLLRNPVDRIISHYYYVLRTPSHYLYNVVTSENMSLSDYVSSGISPELTNGQTRLISGVERVDSITGDEPVSADILEIAKRNLQDYFIVGGLSERFDESLILFKSLLRWRNIFYIKQNVTRSRPSKREIPRKTMEVIEKHNKLDMELYEFAKQMFEEQIREQGASFKDELRTFQLLNKAYGAVGKGYNLPRSGIHKVKAVVRSLLNTQR